MAAPETPDRSSFALFGALAGMLAVGAAALLFVHSAGDPGDHAHVLRVGVAAVIGAGVGAYLGETRRQFILRCAAPLARPLGAVRRGLHRHREKLRLALRLSAAGLAISAWGIFLVAPDWRLQRLIGELQSPDGGVSWGAAIELTQLEELETGFLSQERNRMLLAILREGSAENVDNVMWAARNLGLPVAGAMPNLIERLASSNAKVRGRNAVALGFLGAAAAPAVPKIITLLHDSDDDVRRLAVWTLMELAAPEAIPELAAILADPDSDLHANAINALGSIRARPEVSVPALVEVYSWADTSYFASASYALVGFGPDAAPAIPVLERELECGDEERVWATRRALWSIGHPQFGHNPDDLPDSGDPSTPAQPPGAPQE